MENAAISCKIILILDTIWIIDISLPHTKYALPTYYILTPAEASSNLARCYWLLYGVYFVKAQKVRRLLAQGFEKAFTQVGSILTPTTPTAAFSLDNLLTDPVEMYMNNVLAIPANLAALPAISMQGVLTTDGLPIGLQLIGKSFDEVTLLNATQAIETAANFQGQVLELRKTS